MPSSSTNQHSVIFPSVLLCVISSAWQSGFHTFDSVFLLPEMRHRRRLTSIQVCRQKLQVIGVNFEAAVFQGIPSSVLNISTLRVHEGIETFWANLILMHLIIRVIQ